MPETETLAAPVTSSPTHDLQILQVAHNARAFPGRAATQTALALAYSRGSNSIPDASPEIKHLYGMVRARSYLALLDSTSAPHNSAAPDRDLLPPAHPFSTRAPAQLRTPTPRYQRALTAAIVMDSLGRPWNSLLHPRDRHGKFIPTFGSVRLFRRSPTTGSRDDQHYATGTYMGANPDGSVNVRLNAVNDPTEKNTVGTIKTFPADQVESFGGGGGATTPGEPGRVADRVEKAHIGDIATSAGTETQEYRNVAARNAFNEGIRDLGDVQKTNLTTPNGDTYVVGDTIHADVGTAPSGGDQTTTRTGTILDMVHTSDGRDSALVRFDNRVDTPTPAGDRTPEVSLLDLGSKEVHPGTPETKANLTPQQPSLPPLRRYGTMSVPETPIDWSHYGKPDYTHDGGPKLPQEIQYPSDLFDRGAEEWLHDPRNPNRIGARPHVPNQMYRGASDKSVSAKRTPTPQETWVSGTTDQAGANRPAAPSRQKMKHVGDREIRTADGESAGVGSVIVFNPPSGSGRRSSQYTPGVIGVITNINENANKGYGGARVIVWDPTAPNPDPSVSEPGAWRFLSMTHLSGDRFSLVKEADPALLHSLGKGIDIGGGMSLMPQHKRIARTLTKEQIAAGVKPIDQRSAVDMNGTELRKGDHVVGRTRAGQLIHGHIQNIRPGEDLMDVTPYGGGEAITISTNRTRFMRKASGPYGTADRDDVFYEDAADFNMPVYDHASLDEALAEAGATDAERALFHDASAEDIASRLVDSPTRQRISALAAHYNSLDLNDPERHSPEARTTRMLDHVFRAGLSGRMLASDGGDVQARPPQGQTRAEGDLSEMEAIFPQSFGDFYSDDALNEYLLPNEASINAMAADLPPGEAADLARNAAEGTANQASHIPTDDPHQMTIQMQTIAAWIKAENHPRGPQIQANAAIQAAVAAVAKANQPHRTDEEKADLLARASDNLRAIGNRPGAQGLQPTLNAIADKVDQYAQENGYDRGLRPNAPNAPAADFTPPPPPTPQAPAARPAPTPTPNVPEAPPAPTPTPNVPQAPPTPEPTPTPPPTPTPSAPTAPPPAASTPDFISVADDGTITINDPDVAFDVSAAFDTMAHDTIDGNGGGSVSRDNVLTINDPERASDAITEFADKAEQDLDSNRVPKNDPERDHVNNLRAMADFVRTQPGPAATTQTTTPTDESTFTPTAPGTGPSPSLPISPGDDDWEQAILDSIKDKPQVPALDPATVVVPKPNTVDGTPNKDEMVAALSSGNFQNVLNLLDTWYSQVGYSQTVDAFRAAHTVYARSQGDTTNDPFNVPGWDDAKRDLDAWKTDLGSRMMVQDGFDMPTNSTVMTATAGIYSDLHHDTTGFTRNLVALMDGSYNSEDGKDPEVRAQAAMALAQLTEHMDSLNGHPQQADYAAWYRDQAVRLRSGQDVEMRTRPRINAADDPKFKSVRDANGNIAYWQTADGQAIFQDTRGGTAVFRPATPAEIIGKMGNNSYPITAIDGKQYVQVGKVYLTNSAENRRKLYTNHFTTDTEVLTPVKQRVEWFDVGVFSGQTRFAPGTENWQSISDVEGYDLDRQTRAMSVMQEGSDMRRRWGMSNITKWFRAQGLDPARVQFPTARVHRNGHFNIEVGADTVKAWGDNYDANLKTLTDQVDKLMSSRDAAVWDRPVFIRVSDDVFSNKESGVMAYAYRGNHFIAIKATFQPHAKFGVNGPTPVMAEQIIQDELPTRGIDPFVRDSIGHNNMVATLVHEWGHMADMSDPTLTGRKAQTAEAIRNGTLPAPTSSTSGTSMMTGRLRINDSGEGEWFDGDIAYSTFKNQMSGIYAKDSEPEFVAEAFTEWHLTDGQTQSKVAQFLFGNDAQRIAAFDSLLGETGLNGKMKSLSAQEIQNYMDQGMTRAEARYRAYRNKYSIHSNDVTGHGSQYSVLTGAQSTQDFIQRMYGIRGLENMTPEEVQNYLAAIAPGAALAFAQGLLPQTGVPTAPSSPAAPSAPAGTP